MRIKKVETSNVEIKGVIFKSIFGKDIELDVAGLDNQVFIYLEDNSILILPNAELYYTLVSDPRYYSSFGAQYNPELDVEAFTTNNFNRLECKIDPIVEGDFLGENVLAITTLRYKNLPCYFLQRSGKRK